MFLFTPSGVTWPGMRDMIAKLTALKAETMLIRDQSNKEAAKLKAREVVLPMSLPELYTPIPYIIPAQLFAGRLAAVKGLNPDQPRTIQKVTQTL
jgi:glucosamine--fructose-6-phosphate aminotransferase (isomerizing)